MATLSEESLTNLRGVAGVLARAYITLSPHAQVSDREAHSQNPPCLRWVSCHPDFFINTAIDYLQTPPSCFFRRLQVSMASALLLACHNGHKGLIRLNEKLSLTLPPTSTPRPAELPGVIPHLQVTVFFVLICSEENGCLLACNCASTWPFINQATAAESRSQHNPTNISDIFHLLRSHSSQLFPRKLAITTLPRILLRRLPHTIATTTCLTTGCLQRAGASWARMALTWTSQTTLSTLTLATPALSTPRLRWHPL